MAQNTFSDLLDYIPTISYLFLDNNGKIVKYHDAQGIIPFKDDADVLSKHFSDCYLEQSSELLNHLFAEAEQSAYANTEFWKKTTKGQSVLINCEIIKISEGSDRIGYLKLFSDLTDQNERQMHIEASENLTKVGFWTVDLDTMKSEWSAGVKRIHEVPDDFESNVENGIDFYLEGYDRDRITKVFKRCVEEGKSFNEELRIKTAKGNIRWVKATGIASRFRDKAVKVYGTFIDISEQKEKQFALEQSLQEFRKLFEHSSIGMAIISKEGEWMRVNSRICEIFGYSEEELLNMTFQDLSHPEDVDNDKDLLKDLIDDEISRYEVEKRYYNKSEHTIWVNISVTKINLKNDFYFITQITDITKRKSAIRQLKKRNEKLRQQNIELEQFAYITSHDLQEPLRTIQSFIQLFEKKYGSNVDEKGQKYIEFITDATDRMSTMIHSLLEYNRIGRKKQDKEEIDLNEVVGHVIADLDHQIKSKNAKIKYSHLGKMTGYKQDIKILFQNLISNAVKFTEIDVHPEIEIEVKKIGKKTAISLADNGIGIDDQYKEKVFLIFQRLHKRKDYQGSGIGLALCKKIVELHNGKIWFETNEKSGTTFYLIL